MKKILILLIIIVLCIAVSVSFYLLNRNILRDNKLLYQFFEKEQLVGVDGEVNLSGIAFMRDKSYSEIISLFGSDDYDYEEYLKKIEDGLENNLELSEGIKKMSKEINNLEIKKKSLTSEYNVLLTKYNKLKKSTVVSTNNSYKFPLIDQYPKYPTGCESVALAMLLRYYGISVAPDNIIAKLRKGNVPYYDGDGVLYGGNPELEFVGNPYSNASYGVYEKPIAEVANTFKSGVITKSNFSFNSVINLVQKGTPVMVWTSMNLGVPYISRSWIYKPTMETIKWKANEHAVVIIDVTDTAVVVADPIGGKIKEYSRSVFQSRYNYYGKKVLYYL